MILKMFFFSYEKKQGHKRRKTKKQKYLQKNKTPPSDHMKMIEFKLSCVSIMLIF